MGGENTLRKAVEGSALHVGARSYEEASRRNIERFYGVVRVPVGVAGPLRVQTSDRSDMEDVEIPLATTEGQLVASTCRGMRVIRESGGCHTYTISEGTIQRSPVFVFPGVPEALAFRQFVRGLPAAWFHQVISKTTKSGKFRETQVYVLGSTVTVRICIHPGDAAGQNMVSVAAAAVVKKMMGQYSGVAPTKVFMEALFSGEKIASPGTALLGRGCSVVASVAIPFGVLRRLTRANPDDIEAFVRSIVATGQAIGNSGGIINCSSINVTPAMYIACGQDVASVGETVGNAVNYIRCDAVAQVLHWEVSMPNVVCATVGGGTALPGQAEALGMMGCAGTGKKQRFAELVAATALANEISFLGAIVANEWVEAHAALKSRL